MSTKSPAHQAVEFYAASSRLVKAYASATKGSEGPARFPKLHHLDSAFKIRQLTEQPPKIMVILSLVDEDTSALTDSRVKPMISKAPHLLITELGTHPDQVIQWRMAANIRRNKSICTVKVNDLSSPRLAQLLGRVRYALEGKEHRSGIVDAYVAGDFLHVRGPNLKMLRVPIRSVPAFKGRDLDEIRNFEIDVDGSFIYWPGLDVHLGWEQFLQIVDPAELRKAQQRSKVFNERFGAAIRSVREKAGIAQSKIEGLTERQVRRIEQGECRATSSAINALSKAHLLMPNAYMESVAKAMK